MLSTILDRGTAPGRALLLLALLSGGAQPVTAAPMPAIGSLPLADTAWRLEAMVSMDDAQGTWRPSDPSRYTLTLNRNGSASLQLDCNRATGPWRIVPAADPVSGSFRFGQLASTTASCAGPAQAPRLVQQLAHVRSYLLRDGHLHLSLMADGGTLVWEPVAGDPLVKARRTCLNAVAKVVGLAPSRLQVLEAQSTQTELRVDVTVPKATAPWRCLTDRSARVKEVFFTGSEGSL